VRIADRLFNEGLDAKIFEEAARKGRSALIVATKQATAMNGIAAIASSLGFRRGRGGDRSLSTRLHGSM
jgi:hypothetical protein